MYIYEVQTTYIFTKGLRLNYANKIIAIYCNRGYFLNTFFDKFMQSIKLANRQLGEWSSICPGVRATGVRVLGASMVSCRRLIFVISFISEKLGLTIDFLYNKYVLQYP